MKSTPHKRAIFAAYVSAFLKRQLSIEWIGEDGDEPFPNIDTLTDSPLEYLHLVIFYEDLLNDRLTDNLSFPALI